MKPEVLNKMSDAEINEYAASLGIELAPASNREDKVLLIESRRERSVTVTLLGIPFKVPIKAAYDQRVETLLTKRDRTDEDTFEAMRLMLGEAQTAALVDACTDIDGTIDAAALGVAFVRLITSEELKNF